MMHDKIIEFVARRFQVLGEPCRLRILRVLEGGAMTVNQIVDHLEGNQPNISKHLHILLEAGLVGRKRSGNSIFYSIADPVVFRLCDLVCSSTARQAASLHKYALRKSLNGSRGQASSRPTKTGSLQGVN
jgi:DNA-binding transcriptional ArsR family regulator